MGWLLFNLMSGKHLWNSVVLNRYETVFVFKDQKLTLSFYFYSNTLIRNNIKKRTDLSSQGLTWNCFRLPDQKTTGNPSRPWKTLSSDSDTWKYKKCDKLLINFYLVLHNLCFWLTYLFSTFNIWKYIKQYFYILFMW